MFLPFLLALTSSSLHFNIYSSRQAYQLLTGNPLIPAEKLEDDGKLIGWLMSMSGDRYEKETVLEAKLGREFFDENGTMTLLERINAI